MFLVMFAMSGTLCFKQCLIDLALWLILPHTSGPVLHVLITKHYIIANPSTLITVYTIAIQKLYWNLVIGMKKKLYLSDVLCSIHSMVHQNILLFGFLLNDPIMDFSALKTYLDFAALPMVILSGHYESALIIQLPYTYCYFVQKCKYLSPLQF